MLRLRWLYCLPLAAALAACADQRVKATAHEHADAVAFPISCGAAAQTDFDHALVLLHHMTYPQARTAFRAIAERDSECAIAQWGIAMTLFQPLWPTRPSADDLRVGWDGLQRAQSLKHSSAREQAFIAATAAFFAPDATDYRQRIERWNAAMASLHAAYPNDTEASAFYALSLLASARPGPTTEEHARQASELLLPILKDNPNHPGAMHYMIHADDTPTRERENLDIVHHYEDIAPDNPHALHMPTHIYVRLGDWDGVIRGNLRAADAALKYPAGEHGEFVWDEFAHAIEYLVYAYLQKGEDDPAKAQIARLLATPNIEPTAKTAFHLASTRARYALERRDWAAARALVPREPAIVDWDRSPWPEGIVWFARGYGAIRSGDAAEANRAVARLADLQARAAKSGEDVFARQIEVLRLELSAWIARANEGDAAAIALMQKAVDLESATPKPPVTPAPTLPAAELLGDLLIEIGKPGEALEPYRKAAQAFPNRFNGTLALARTLAATGDVPAAADYYCRLVKLAPRSERAALGEARAFLEREAARTGHRETGCTP